MTRGDGRISSLANLTAAMIEAAITSVEAKRSCFALSCSSREMARLISPIFGSLGETKAKVYPSPEIAPSR
jgi:hypothetical protein